MTPERDFRETLVHAIGSEYEILEELGRGGSSVVYHARDRMLGREVAVKVIRGSQLEDPEAVTRFEREARVLARLQHPHIVMLYAAKQLPGGSLALVMQHSSTWKTLKALVRDGGPLPVEAAEQILRDLASALEYLHGNQIVHRDIKPENIFVEMETGRALLADFGIAKPGDGQASVTLTGVVIGTPAYMSPEQIDGIGVTGRSDLYSLGMVGYEMLTGRRPWAGESLYSVIFRQKTEKLPALDGVRPDVTPRLQRAIERATEKEPADRWPDARALLAHLEDAAPAPVAAPEPRVPAAWAPVALPAEETPTIDVAGALAEVARLENEPLVLVPRPQARRPWRRTGIAAALVLLLGAGAAAVATTRPETEAMSLTPEGMERSPAGGAPEYLATVTTPVAPLADSATEVAAAGQPLDDAAPDARPSETAPASPAPAARSVSPAPRRVAPAPDGRALLGAVALPSAPRIRDDESGPTATLPAAARVAPPLPTRAPTPGVPLPELQNPQAFASDVQRLFFTRARTAAEDLTPRTVVVAVLVNETGSVVDSEIRRSSGLPELDETVQSAARLMQFTPSRNLDVPSRVWVTVPLNIAP